MEPQKGPQPVGRRRGEKPAGTGSSQGSQAAGMASSPSSPAEKPKLPPLAGLASPPDDLTNELTSEIDLLPPDEATPAAPAKPAAPGSGDFAPEADVQMEPPASPQDDRIIEMTPRDDIDSPKNGAGAKLLQEATDNVVAMLREKLGTRGTLNYNEHINARFTKQVLKDGMSKLVCELQLPPDTIDGLSQFGFNSGALAEFKKRPRMDMWRIPDDVKINNTKLAKHIAFSPREKETLASLQTNPTRQADALRQMIDRRTIKRDDVTFIHGLKPSGDPPSVPDGVVPEDDRHMIEAYRYISVKVPKTTMDTLASQWMQTKTPEKG